MNEKTVLVTGGTGYLGSWVIKSFMDKGWNVKTTVRQSIAPEYRKVLDEISKDSGKDIEVFTADLLQPHSFDSAMQGVDVLVHTASPFMAFGTKDPKQELLDPAVMGTENVLTSASSANVKRVVLTSSVAAMYGDGKEISDKILDESYWNNVSSLSYRPYEYSKTMAEKTAWEYAKSLTLDLVTINPGFILGPALTMRKDSSSISIMNDFVTGKYKTGIPNTWIGIVDVRDVALAHVLAAENNQIKGRNIICANTISFLEMADAIRKHIGNGEPVPKSTVPKWLFWLLSPLFGIERAYVSGNIGFQFSISNQKSLKDFSLQYRDWEETVVEHYLQLKL